MPEDDYHKRDISDKILKLYKKISYEDDVAKIRKFLNDFDYNKKYGNELTLDSSAARRLAITCKKL